MSASQISIMETDTGQIDIENINSNSNNADIEKELANFDQNQEKLSKRCSTQ